MKAECLVCARGRLPTRKWSSLHKGRREGFQGGYQAQGGLTTHEADDDTADSRELSCADGCAKVAAW